MNGESISARTIGRALKEAGMKAVVKRKRPRLTKRHRRKRLDFALAHKNWTVEDWKRLFGQMRLKSIVWGQMEESGYGKRQEKVSVIGWLRAQSSLKGEI